MKRLVYALFLLLAVHGVDAQDLQYSYIDTTIIECAKINTKQVGGFCFYNDSLWLLLKSYNQCDDRPRLEVNEFYHVKHKFKEWNLYVFDTLTNQLIRKADEIYLPWSQPTGFSVCDSGVFYVARKRFFLSNSDRLTFADTNTERYNSDNTLKRQISYPFYSKKENKLYFSMKDVYGFGGYDIFYAEITKGGIGEPQNMGKLVNTKYDEIAPWVARDGLFYFSSNRIKKKSFELFCQNPRTPEKIEHLKNLGNKHKDIWICDAPTKTRFFINYEKRQAVISKFYARRISTPMQNLDIIESMVTIDPSLIPDTKLAAVKMRGVNNEEKDLTKLFQLNMYELTPMMTDSLIQMAEFLRNNPDKHLLIVGHASPDGPEYINVDLSINRANSAYEYLLETEKIESKRISIIYGGEYLFTDTIKARRFSMYTLLGQVIPELMAVYILKPDENAKSIYQNFELDAEEMENYRFELDPFIPVTSERLYLPIKAMMVTKRSRSIESIAKQFQVDKTKLKKANRFDNEILPSRTIIYIPK
ncbi:MAG: OmpA family protein [Prolixibacteraceae bacterium]|nr:OmpA family protein [Prolixibacteraceae bacterium]